MDKGKAFEFACMMGLEEFLRLNAQDLNFTILRNSSYDITKRYFDELQEKEPTYAEKLINAGFKLGEILLKTEPKLFNTEPSLSRTITISLQPDTIGVAGDVRDMILIKTEIGSNIKWEVGISCKHNNDAVRHQRVSPSIDFGKKWLNFPLVTQEIEKINEIFNQVDYLSADGIHNWSEIPNKESLFYQPILDIVISKILSHPHQLNLAQHLLTYLIGSHDFYKILVYPNGKYSVQGFNFQGTLNLSSEITSPTLIVNKLPLPTRITHIDYKHNSKTTLEIFFDNEWKISMRIHNASTKLEKSLKMDVRLTGMPASMFSYNGII